MMSNGKILLVGIGPGSEEHMTLRARRAIEEADVIVGYTGYVKLIAHLIEGKEVIRKGMRQELERCTAALEQARRGKAVALISSGDTGIYGIASPTYEVLLQSGWRPDDGMEDGIEVETIPGCTALSTCAALVGAPLGHDFCAISLSDLLTPWPVIAERLDAAARGDFVIALYNPKSHHRTWQLAEAQAILSRYRKPATPVAIVSAAYRKRQNTELTTLNEMLGCAIDMSSTVLVGSSTTYTRAGLMITPRGYGGK